MARLIFVNRFYWPDETATGQLLTDLAETLAAHGHDVTVITSRPMSLAAGEISERHGVHIAHVASTRLHRGRLTGKAIDFATFFLGACWQLFRRARRDTIVIAMTDPPLIGTGVCLVAGMRGARLVHWVQDIYPELAIELTGHGWLKPFRPLRDRAWRTAVHSVTLGAAMASRLHAAGVPANRISIIPNWAPAGLEPSSAAAVSELRAAWGLNGKVVVGYSGNLGRVHDLESVLGLAAALRDQTDIAFVFVGDGAQRERLREIVAQRALANVSFQPAQPRAQLAVSLAAIDIHLVTLRAGCESLVFPSKLYGVAASGRPVVFLGPSDSEIARTVLEHGMGVTGSRDEITGLAAAIRRLAADPVERARCATAAVRFAKAHDARAAAGRWNEILEDAEGSHVATSSANEGRNS